MSQWPLANPSIRPPQSHFSSSRRNSSYSFDGNRRNSTSSFQPAEGLFTGMAANTIDTLKAEVMANYLYIKQQENMWTTGTQHEGVILKQARNSWVSYPPYLSTIPGSLFDAISGLNVRV